MDVSRYLSTVLTSCALPPRLAVAVSGGADSMALALLLHAQGHAITALTVDHGLRPEAAAEAAQVKAWMEARGIAHHTLTPPALDFIPNIQTRAREMRYAAMGQWCRSNGIEALLVAHHADDQAETVALQQHRGTSPPSRAGMALVSRRGEMRLIRPLLGVRKAQLIDALQAIGQPWIEDPSNASDAYARNRLRGTLTNEDVRRLWLEAQAQGEQRHKDDVARNAWVAEHVSACEEGLQFPLPVWRAMPTEAGTDLLSRAVQAVGRQRHRARLHKSVRLAFLLRTEEQGKETLGHCIITWDEHRIRITPELKRSHVPSPAGGGLGWGHGGAHTNVHAAEAPLPTPPLRVEVHQDAGLEAMDEPSHITSANPLKLLACEPFWWFNFPPHF